MASKTHFCFETIQGLRLLENMAGCVDGAMTNECMWLRLRGGQAFAYPCAASAALRTRLWSKLLETRGENLDIEKLSILTYPFLIAINFLSASERQGFFRHVLI